MSSQAEPWGSGPKGPLWSELRGRAVVSVIQESCAL